MNDLSRRNFLTGAVAALATLATRAHAAVPSLKDACNGLFLIGTALDFRTPMEFTSAELDFIRSQFNAITPENSMKPGPVHPQEQSWNWTQPDTLVQFAQDNGIRVFGHCLVWHAQTNPWFFQDANRDVLLARLRNHIHTLVGHFKGRLSSWDVVNEAINDGEQGTGENLRESPWLKIVGADFLTQAFRFAREADPAVALLYNDYSIESGAKHQSSLLLLRRLVADGAPITGVGIQGHWSLPALTTQKYEEIDRAIENYRALKLRVSITELDVSVTGTAGGQLGRGQANAEPPSPDVLAAQADAYGKLFTIFMTHRAAIDRVTFWGLSDRRSWRRTRYPLAFDADYQPKPALQAIIDAVAQARARG
ncbi:MAG TPA: endo-1,4-beta-xylanase [Gemmatimonadales bacterium]|nr:endo-1,4-beta-xylanase [Gemmatimonadales bacterium]